MGPGPVGSQTKASQGPRLDPLQVTVVFPCLNEREAVGLCVEQALEAMRAGGIRARCSSWTMARPTARRKLAEEAGAPSDA